MTTSVQRSAETLADTWPELSRDARVKAFNALPRGETDDFFLQLDPREQADLIFSFPEAERRIWVRLLAPDDAADLFQNVSSE